MRSIVFFDLPVETASQRKAYSSFVKELKKQGFYMLQESVYVKMDMDQQSSDGTKERIKKKLPTDGMIALLRITEKQFSSIDFLIGESSADVLTTDERIVEL